MPDTLPETMAKITIRNAAATDTAAIVEIYNESVIGSTASFDLLPKTVGDYTTWFYSHDGRHPIIVADQDGAVAGWASLSRWSDRAAYDGAAEISLYIRRSHWNRGIGRTLLAEIVHRGKKVGLHTVLSRITGDNTISIALHESMGFTHAGVMREMGLKFGRLLDVVTLQLIYDERQ